MRIIFCREKASWVLVFVKTKWKLTNQLKLGIKPNFAYTMERFLEIACIQNIAWEQAKKFFLLFHAIPNNIKSSLTTIPDKFDNRLFANITNRRDKKQNNTERKTYISKTLSRAEIEKYTYNQALQERASFQALFPIGPKFLFYPSLYYLVQHRFLPLS